MAKQAQATISDDAEPSQGRPRTATKDAGAPVEKPAVALVAEDAPVEEPKRRRQAVAKPIRKPKPPKAKSKAAPEILALVETEEESGQYESEEIGTLVELLDVMDEGRKVFVTRNWREF